jgi:protoporphyrinogen/coproporphyrinogen III oxidase
MRTILAERSVSVAAVPASVAVVGGGLWGLAVAHTLQALGARVNVFEASRRVGGGVSTVVENGYVGESGPPCAVRSNGLAALVDELNLASEAVDVEVGRARLYAVRRERLCPVPSTLSALLGTPALSWAAKVRLLSERWQRADPAAHDESVGSFVRRRLGSEVLDTIIGPAVACWTGGDAERLSLLRTLPAIAAAEDEHGSLTAAWMAARRSGGLGELESARLLSFRDGMQTLTDALACALGPAIHTSSAVTAITRVGTGWAITVSRSAGGGRRVAVDAVVYAGPAHAIGGIDWPDSVDPIVAPLRAIPYASRTVLTLGFRREHVGHPLDGLGLVVPTDAAYTIRGALFVSSLFPGRAPLGHVAVSCVVGGPRRTGLGSAATETIEGAAVADLRRLVGLRGEPSFVHRATSLRAVPQYELGHDAVDRALSIVESAHPGLYFGGSWVGGVGIEACIRNARALAHRVVAECALDQRLATPRGIVVGRIPAAHHHSIRLRPWPRPPSTSSPSPHTPTTSN